MVYLTDESVFGKYTSGTLYNFYVRMHGNIRNAHSVVQSLALLPYPIIILLPNRAYGLFGSTAGSYKDCLPSQQNNLTEKLY